MTHPLTPREKVARIVDPLVFELAVALDNAEGEPAALRRDATEMRDMRMSEAFSKADAILTALASGSGDHAELAAKADRCTTGDPWYKDDDLRGRQSFEQFLPQDRAFIAAASPNTVLTLLAENAALRADGEVYQSQADHEFGLRKEAERKLAEARDWIRGRDCECHLIYSSSACDRCTFLSKEAERG
ncbi:hypothetical protein [Brevundimonas naejangsanensis]|uniref:hypothetical protein n=1 Tax=Brevundimonas naejangsanensis TaxID=588932 RepID=UPI003208F433